MFYQWKLNLAMYLILLSSPQYITRGINNSLAREIAEIYLYECAEFNNFLPRFYLDFFRFFRNVAVNTRIVQGHFRKKNANPRDNERTARIPSALININARFVRFG